jgi:hypothetical protein
MSGAIAEANTPLTILIGLPVTFFFYRCLQLHCHLFDCFATTPCVAWDSKPKLCRHSVSSLFSR